MADVASVKLQDSASTPKSYAISTACATSARPACIIRVSLLLENQAFSTPIGTVEPHYFLKADETPDDLKNSLRRNRNIKILSYNKVDSDHSGLVDAVEDLLEKVNSAREELSQNNNW